MSISTTDHYEILGVRRDASAADLKAAYLRLIREHTPESDPEMFRLVSEAYRTLSNPEKRREYDRGDRLDDEVAKRLVSIQRQAEDDPAGAIEELRSLSRDLEGKPGERQIDRQLGIILFGQELYIEAVEIFERLVESDSEDLSANVWLGDALVGSGNHELGRKILREVIVRDKDCTEAYISYARACVAQEEHAEAVTVLERGINADGSVDIKDLPLFIEKIVVLSLMDEWSDLQETAKQLLDAVPPSDQEARQYVAASLWPLAQAYMGAERADLVHFILEIVVECDPENSSARDFRDQLAEAARSQRDRKNLYKDESVAGWLKGAVAIWSGDEDPPNLEEIQQKLFLVILSRTAECRREFDHAAQRYPHVMGPYRSTWDRLMAKVGSVAQRRGSSTPASSGSGCLVLLVVALPAVASAIGGFL